VFAQQPIHPQPFWPPACRCQGSPDICMV
jgi:hypothetical protein